MTIRVWLKRGFMEYKDKRLIMDENGIKRVMVRVTHEILERNKGVKNLAIIGIRSGGVYLAKRIANFIKEIENIEVPTGIVDITLYRDDLRVGTHQPRLRKTEIPFSVDEKKIILVDDVLYTGRTIRAALDAIMDFGRPKVIQLAVLIDRGHRELPIRADYVGKNLPTSKVESVHVMLKEECGEDKVIIQDILK